MTKSIASFPAISALIILGISCAAPTEASADRITDEVQHEMTFLEPDLAGCGEEYSNHMDFAIHHIVNRNAEPASQEARRALDGAREAWGDDHLYTQMASAMLKLAEANEIELHGGAKLSVASRKIAEARAFIRDNREFPGSYYIDILAYISDARISASFGVNELAKDYYGKALYAMEQEPGMAGNYEIEMEMEMENETP